MPGILAWQSGHVLVSWAAKLLKQTRAGCADGDAVTSPVRTVAGARRAGSGGGHGAGVREDDCYIYYVVSDDDGGAQQCLSRVSYCLPSVWRRNCCRVHMQPGHCNVRCSTVAGEYSRVSCAACADCRSHPYKSTTIWLGKQRGACLLQNLIGRDSLKHGLLVHDFLF